MCKRILVLDDDLAILGALSDILEYSGYYVSTLSRGDKVFEKIRECHPDLILLDVMLADLDGRDICQNIKQKHDTESIPVILISATHNLSECLNHAGPPNDFVAKPFDMNNLLYKIERQIGTAA